VCSSDLEASPDWIQQELPTGEPPVHEAFDDPWGNG
jgi:hypothetical protein